MLAYKHKRKPNHSVKEDIPIAIIGNDDYIELYCSDCNRKLLHMGRDNYRCGSCGIEYYPESQSIKHGTELQTWDGPVDSTGSIDNSVNISYTPEPEITRKKERKLKGAFKSLEESSGTLHFTDYVSNEYEEEEDE